MDFSADLNGIAEQLNSAVANETPVATPDPSPSLQGTPETQQTPASASSEPVSTPVDDAIEVTFKDGTKQSIKRSELPDAILRQQDYTRKTQAIAQRAKQYEELEAQLPQIRQEIEFAQQMRQATQDPEALFRYVVEQIGPQKAIQLFSGQIQQNPGAYDPNDIPTYQEADKLINDKLSAYEQKLQEMEQRHAQQIEERILAERQQLQFEREAKDYAVKFNTLIEKSFSDHPELRAIDLVEDTMRFKVGQKIDNFRRLNGVDPSFEVAATWFNDAVKEQVTKLNTQFAAVKAASPLNNSIEPAGGNRPVNMSTQAQSFYNSKTGELDSDAQLKALTERIKAVSRL